METHITNVATLPERMTFKVEDLAQWLAEARDAGFAEGMLEAGACDTQRWEAMLKRSQLHPILTRFYAAQIRLRK